jgi:hypothetical protein
MALTQTDLDAINGAIASGELTVRTSNGSQVTYRSMDELIKARDIAKADIASASGSVRAYPRHQLADFSDD